MGKGFLVVDYGHNPEAFRAIGKMVANWNAPKVTGVIAVPGDRSDDVLRLSALAAVEAFDKIIIREDLDLRGRPSGAAARIICDEVSKQKSEMAAPSSLTNGSRSPARYRRWGRERVDRVLL